ncbi:helix-turn-helix transcriptional regulator [uncultured Negativibacillus sp.]|nr:helix-turn-helix transcriptional regulator [uncultured Negativibacillus sp.]
MKGYHIGFCIRRKREEQGVSQSQLCYGICDRTTLSRIECGKS